MSSSPPHALVLCFPEQSHMNKLLLLSTKLASLGITITFVLSDYTLAARQESHPLHPSPPSNFRFVGVPDGLPHDCNRASFRSAHDAIHNMRHGVELLADQLFHPQVGHPVTFLLADVFAPWSQHLASAFGVPCVVFFISSAVACSVGYHHTALESMGILPFRDENDNFIAKDPVTCIPGVSPLHPADFPSLMTFQPSHYQYQFLKRSSELLQAASAIIINTVEELETSTIAELKKLLPIYAVGPLSLLCGGEGEASAAGVAVNYWQEQGECLRWLDAREDLSVLYVAFGGVSTLPEEHLQELALGLEASQQPFLWVIRPDSASGSLSDILPPDFLSRTKDRGLIISWAPQSAVLAHPAVGGFLSHCGWSSIMESVGIPMLCWPQRGEQRVSCRIVLDHLKTGVELKRQGEDGKLAKEEVERVVRVVMQGQGGVEVRKRAREVRDTCRKAAEEEDGSSKKNIEAFVRDISGGKLQQQHQRRNIL